MRLPRGGGGAVWWHGPQAVHGCGAAPPWLLHLRGRRPSRVGGLAAVCTAAAPRTAAAQIQ